jgi:TPR repeat protein
MKRTPSNAMYCARCLLLVAVVLFMHVAHSMERLPRNMHLKAFDPHRKTFTCKHEADAVPAIDPEADQWNRQALGLTSRLLWPEDRDYKTAIQLWQRAAERKHWKAMLNLVNAYAHGEGVQRDTEHAVQIIEAAMRLGIPAAYDLMGTYHMDGIGVKPNASRAYAFWELAADMGSASAQAYIGSKLVGIYDDPRGSFWGNRKIALKMLECGFAQGNGDAAYELGFALRGTDKSLDEDNDRALHALHEGVKFGHADCASSLFVAFSNGKPIVNSVKDPSRADRYDVLAEALFHDPDLRLPNLDKILPLPPAVLPQWDGKKQTLIDAARANPPTRAPSPASAPKPVLPPSSQRTRGDHILDNLTARTTGVGVGAAVTAAAPA